MKAIFPPIGARPARSIATERSYRDVTARLRDAIVDGHFQPNERLVEQQLAKQLETSRAAIRVALSILEQEQLVVHEANRGARVRAYTIEEADEIIETRAVLEALVARTAAAKIDDAGADVLREILTDMEVHERAGNLRRYSDGNSRFHAAISRIADHRTSAHLLSLLKSQSVRHQYRSVLNPGRPTKSLAEHRRIFEALAARDGDAAERAMRVHISNVRAAVRETAAILPP